ncbi:MAG: asparagine synthase-related protein, partial [Novosphingobium sp.]
MSGICGIVSLDGAPVDQGDLLGMAKLLEHRSPHAMTQWFGIGAALGHGLLATTPEAVGEAQPFQHEPSGCVITADVRLDNRDDLFEQLGLGPSHRGMGDAELILRSYLKWGSDCACHLLGDFAFAIWDRRKRYLFAARDHMGIRQLSWWHGPGKALIFASEPQAILACKGVRLQINEGAIADYLDNLSAPDFESTWFEGIFRLPPGHRLELSPGGPNISPYWELLPAQEPRGTSYEEYCECLRNVLTEAVRCRLRSHKPVGATLSGGMDSGAVCAIAGQILATTGLPPLKTYSVVGPDPATCIETRSIQIACAMPGLDPHMLGFAEMADHIAESGGIAGACAEPRDLFMTVIRGLYHAASRDGVNVMLDGVNGDVAFA